MLRYIVHRSLISLVMVLGVGTVVFFLIHLVPGDVVNVILGGGQASQEQYQKIRQNLGLDKPLYKQYGIWLSKMVQGDLGTSLITERKVGPDILRQVPRTSS